MVPSAKVWKMLKAAIYLWFWHLTIENVAPWTHKWIHEYKVPTKITLNSVIYTMSFIPASDSFAENKTLRKFNNHQSISVPSRLPSRESDKHSSPGDQGDPATETPQWMNRCIRALSFDVNLDPEIRSADHQQLIRCYKCCLYLGWIFKGNATAVMLSLRALHQD